jgi:hypothetical protein
LLFYADTCWPVTLAYGIVEACFVERIYKKSKLETLKITFYMNLVSTLVGFLLMYVIYYVQMIPLPFMWILSPALLNTFIESAVLQTMNLKVDRTIFGLVFTANVISVALSMTSLYFPE